MEFRTGDLTNMKFCDVRLLAVARRDIKLTRSSEISVIRLRFEQGDPEYIFKCMDIGKLLRASSDVSRTRGLLQNKQANS
jgi:hypothetical protein